MLLEFLVEDFSTEKFLLEILPKILPPDITYNIHFFRGKADLLKKLPQRLRGYKHFLKANHKIIVLVDKDNDECTKLKLELEKIALNAGFMTKSNPQPHQAYQVLNPIAVEELEAWFFGDIQAIASAYPRVSPNLGKKEKYREPDAIKGGTWENLEKVLQQAGYHPGGLEKVKAAQEISKYMIPKRNTSKSFQVFYAGLQEILLISKN